jgi:electron transfer flavoprotein beta subunit
VVIVTLGAPRAVEAMRQALAMGADRGIRIDNTGAGLDTYSTALALAKVVQEEKFDIVFAGKQAVDDDCAATVQYVSELAGIPHAAPIETFAITADNKKAVVQRPVAGGMKEMIEIDLPCVLGCEKGLNTPRYASLPGIMKAKTKPIAERRRPTSLAAKGSRFRRLRGAFLRNAPPEKRLTASRMRRRSNW